METVWRGCPFLLLPLSFSPSFLYLGSFLTIICFAKAHTLAKVCAASPCSMPGVTVTVVNVPILPSFRRAIHSRVDITHEIPMSISTVIQPTNTPHGKGDCHFNSIMNWLSFDFFHGSLFPFCRRMG